MRSLLRHCDRARMLGLEGWILLWQERRHWYGKRMYGWGVWVGRCGGFEIAAIFSLYTLSSSSLFLSAVPLVGILTLRLVVVVVWKG